MLNCILSALIVMQEQKQQHGDIRSETILMTAPSLNNPLRHSLPLVPPIYKVTRISDMT